MSQVEGLRFLFTHFEVFFLPFQEYVKGISEEDYKVLTTEFEGGKNSEWDNQNGSYSIKMRELIKKYFDIKVGLIPWTVPQCAGGIFVLLEADTMVLDEVAKKIKMKEEDYKITTREGAIEMMESVTF